MICPTFSRTLATATLLLTSLGYAQTTPPTSQARTPNLAPPPAPPGSTGPDAPVGKVTESLEAKLAAMQRGDGLTADDVARRTLLRSPSVAEKSSDLRAVDATLDQTRAGFYPKLALSARYTRLSHINLPPLGPGFPAFPVFLDNYNLQATLTLPLSDYVLRMSSALAGANHSKSAAQIDEQAARLAAARDAKLAYYEWIRAQGANYVALQALEAARGHLNDAKNSFVVGLSSKADVLRAESQLKTQELAAERVGNSVTLATQQLRVLMRDSSEKNYEVGENILVDLAAYPTPASADAGYAEALEHRLEMRSLGESEASLREQASIARTGGYPKLEAQANAIYANPHPRYFPAEDRFHGTWDASLILSWTPTDMFGTQAQGRVAQAQAEGLAAKRDQLKDALRLEVEQSLSALKEATFALESSRQGLAAAEESYRVRRELFRAGKATLVEVTDAETELTRARLEVVNAHVDLRIARVVLAHTLGRDAGS